eukprot:Gregarina_sp_Pseudo_9__4343@NODE_44_length_5141_cov_31_667385_g41_i0_p3_GENE_NODE_44_length_5141_cov_31_667385_g41_i0NODE_44_length_5141_cov_31_667385_g41_i0_p3_ORF_typecomplete_len426_score29_22Nup160/PF11715_8/16Nup160/PF11715_8/0_057WD40_like/PF17005_5/8_5e02WD40_like/PF17005_5/0_19_NODE_44_length_5141_cov_31_667385_g41_i037675044
MLQQSSQSSASFTSPLRQGIQDGGELGAFSSSVGDKENLRTNGGQGSTAATHVPHKMSSILKDHSLDANHDSSLVAIPISPFTTTPLTAVSTITSLPISDPVSAMHVGSTGLTFGTYMGKVVCIQFAASLSESDTFAVTPSTVQTSLKAHLCMYAAFSEDAIRMVYSTVDKVYAVVGNSYCVDWPRRSNIIGVREDATRFDRRISQSVKYVLPNGSRCLIASLGVTVVFDCVSQVQLLCPLRLPDMDVVPLDFSDNRMLAFIHNLEAPGPALKILKLPTSQEEPKWGVAVESIFHQDLPGVTGIAKAKFWGSDRFVFIANGRHIYVFQISTGKEIVHWVSGRYDICGLAPISDDCLITISEDSSLAMWSLTQSRIIYNTSLRPCRFSLGIPFHIATYNNLVFFSADEEIGCVTVPLRRTEQDNIT